MKTVREELESLYEKAISAESYDLAFNILQFI